jgi:hypothetical protein
MIIAVEEKKDNYISCVIENGIGDIVVYKNIERYVACHLFAHQAGFTYNRMDFVSQAGFADNKYYFLHDKDLYEVIINRNQRHINFGYYIYVENDERKLGDTDYFREDEINAIFESNALDLLSPAEFLLKFLRLKYSIIVNTAKTVNNQFSG